LSQYLLNRPPCVQYQRIISGKSSTILLLLRLIDPIPGCRENIIIDGVRLDRVNRSTLRQRIIAVSQDPVFLPDGTSFKENLDPFGTSTEDECRDVLETVDLWRFLKEQGGLDIGFSADTLSQGQKQLFSLARAILRRRIRSREAHTHFLISGKNNDADISVSTIQNGSSKSGSCAGGLLLLDEVSSSVDKDTDRAIRAIIKHEFADYTIVMVSHRLDMVLEFDKVLIMDKGSIIESGKPRELINQEGSSFKNLWVVGRHHT
jgi:ATP-binding cassette, subfamily C (CFTR/MRP), member 1